MPHLLPQYNAFQSVPSLLDNLFVFLPNITFQSTFGLPVFLLPTSLHTTEQSLLPHHYHPPAQLHELRLSMKMPEYMEILPHPLPSTDQFLRFRTVSDFLLRTDLPVSLLLFLSHFPCQCSSFSCSTLLVSITNSLYR